MVAQAESRPLARTTTIRARLAISVFLLGFQQLRRGCSPFRRIGESLIFVLILFALAPSGNAEPAALTQAAELQARIDEEEIYLEPTWLALLAYRPLPLRGGWASQADRPDYFLSPEGKHDPRGEMMAAVQAFFGTEPQNPDGGARCRFPARFLWLQGALGLEGDIAFVQQCPELRTWYRSVAADSVSIDFASAFLESPSSTFGHTFLHFHRAGVPPLLSPTSNYAADSGKNTGQVAFVVQGLLGGFPGIVDELPFYRRLRTYGDVDGRDVWQYPLHLNADQIRLLQLHLWEVKDGVFDYDFLGENCSYRTLALISVAHSKLDLLAGFKREVVPIDTIRTLRQLGLVGEPIYWPSAMRTLSRRTSEFSFKEKRLVVAIATGELSPDDVVLGSESDRAHILAAAAQYSSILIHRGSLDFETRDRVTRTIVRERLKLNGPLPSPPLDVPSRPDDGHGGTMLSLGWINRHGIDGVELGFAGFQHERIDPLPGYQRGAEIVFLGLRYRIDGDGGNGVERLDLLRIESTMPTTVFFSQPAWSLHLGAVRKAVDSRRPLVGTLAYAYGWAVDVGLGVAALRLGASLDSAPELRGGMAMEGLIRSELTRQSDWWSSQIFVEHGRYVFGDHSHRLDYGFSIGVPLPWQQSIALEFRRGGADRQTNQFLLEVRQFF